MRQLYYTFRTLLNRRGLNLAKIISLTLGLFMGILLFARVTFELSFDNHYYEADKLCAVNVTVHYKDGEKKGPYPTVMAPVPAAISENFPEDIESATVVRVQSRSNTLFNGSTRLEPKVILADSLFFRTMGIEVLKGNPYELGNPETMFISESFARKAFGNEDPIGKVLLYKRSFPMTVKGVYADIPENSSLRHDVVISFATIIKYEWECVSWTCGDSFEGYIRLKETGSLEKVNSRIDKVIEKYLPFDLENDGFGMRYSLQPIREVYAETPVVHKMIMIMSLLGFVILFIAAMNYVLISVSSLASRAKAIGVHKCSGASGENIFSMFLWETSIIILVSLILVGILVLNFDEQIEDIASASLSSLFAWRTLWVPVCVILVLFLFVGIIPGYLFSSIPVTQVFRRYTEGRRGWKRSLLFVQFTGMTFIFGVLCVVLIQYNRITTKPLGYNADGVAFTYHSFDDPESALDNLRRLSMVKDVAVCWSNITSGYSGQPVADDNGAIVFTARLNVCSYNYAPFMGIRIKEGKNLDGPNQVLVNEKFVKSIHWTDGAVGMRYEDFTVVGVMEDFPVSSYYNELKPVVFMGQQDVNDCYHVRLKAPYEENLRLLNKTIREMYPTEDIVFISLQKTIDNQYLSVLRFRNAVILAFIVILLISLMGLIGYTNDEVRRHSKEIAIRKVNGAEASNILKLLSKEVIWVALPAVLLGATGAYFMGIHWLGQFTEQIHLKVYWFVLIALAIMAVIVISVMIKSWHIANENPVKSIKNE